METIVANKARVDSAQQAPDVFYGLIGKAMATNLLKAVPAGYAPVVLMFDSALTGKLKGAFLKALKPHLNSLGRPYRIIFRPVQHDVNGQTADFYAWSTFRMLESGDREWFAQLPGSHAVVNIFTDDHTKAE